MPDALVVVSVNVNVGMLKMLPFVPLSIFENEDPSHKFFDMDTPPALTFIPAEEVAAVVDCNFTPDMYLLIMGCVQS